VFKLITTHGRYAVSSNKTEKVFTEGLFFDEPRDGAPEFVIGGLTVSVDRFTDWLFALPKSDKGYVKIDIKRSRAGKIYMELDTWTPPRSEEAARPERHNDADGDDDGIPF